MPIKALCRAAQYVKQTFHIISYENTEYGFSWETGVTIKYQ